MKNSEMMNSRSEQTNRMSNLLGMLLLLLLLSLQLPTMQIASLVVPPPIVITFPDRKTRKKYVRRIGRKKCIIEYF